MGMMFMHMWSMLLYVLCLLHVYVCYMLLYVICLCNHIHLKVVVGPGAQLCTLLEVWVLGAGMSTLVAQTDVRRG